VVVDGLQGLRRQHQVRSRGDHAELKVRPRVHGEHHGPQQTKLRAGAGDDGDAPARWIARRALVNLSFRHGHEA
jgi:hypothetical protein